MSDEIDKILAIKRASDEADALWQAYQTAIAAGDLEQHSVAFSATIDDVAPSAVSVPVTFYAYTKKTGEPMVDRTPGGGSVDIAGYLAESINDHAPQILSTAAAKMLDDARSQRTAAKQELQGQIDELDTI